MRVPVTRYYGWHSRGPKQRCPPPAEVASHDGRRLLTVISRRAGPGLVSAQPLSGPWQVHLWSEGRWLQHAALH